MFAGAVALSERPTTIREAGPAFDHPLDVPTKPSGGGKGRNTSNLFTPIDGLYGGCRLTDAALNTAPFGSSTVA